MSKVFLALGSNIGDCSNNLRVAIAHIEKRIGGVISLSAFYETAPWGFDSAKVFQNAVVEVESSLSAKVILENVKSIESEMGRNISERNGNYADRVIDIDLLFFDDCIISTDKLTIPHQLLHKRDFVLRPMMDIAPDFIHPVLNKTIQELWQELNSES
ncbi:MAG: 2-amino-4-hydroxy-6-hydroxymethyldihydropteridine diphosphokinase [Bacteroidales bacterium]